MENEKSIICPYCDKEISYTDKDLEKIETRKPLPFSRIIKVYEDAFLECPNCGRTIAILVHEFKYDLIPGSPHPPV